MAGVSLFGGPERPERKGFWNHPHQLRKVTKVRHVTRVSLHEGPERPLCSDDGEAWIALETPKKQRCQSNGIPAKVSY